MASTMRPRWEPRFWLWQTEPLFQQDGVEDLGNKLFFSIKMDTELITVIFPGMDPELRKDNV